MVDFETTNMSSKHQLINFNIDICNLRKLFSDLFFNLVDESSILIPDFHLYYFIFNDRFAITHFKNYKIYGTLYEKLLEYSRIKKLHSEQFHYYYLSKLLTIKYIPFYFQRIRANGKIEEQDEFLSKI